MAELTIEEENKVIDSFADAEFWDVMYHEFGAAGAAGVIGYATLYGLTGKKSTVEARGALVALGLSESLVYKMYQQFRRLRRALLARRGFATSERRGGPGANGGVPPIVARLRDLKTV